MQKNLSIRKIQLKKFLISKNKGNGNNNGTGGFGGPSLMDVIILSSLGRGNGGGSFGGGSSGGGFGGGFGGMLCSSLST